MNLVVSLLVAFPLGLLIRNRIAAHLAYVALFLFLYVSTAVLLVIAWAGGDTRAFGPFPQSDPAQTWSFFGISAAAFTVGGLLVHLGAVVRQRRATRHPVATAAGSHA